MKFRVKFREQVFSREDSGASLALELLHPNTLYSWPSFLLAFILESSGGSSVTSRVPDTHLKDQYWVTDSVCHSLYLLLRASVYLSISNAHSKNVKCKLFWWKKKRISMPKSGLQKDPEKRKLWKKYAYVHIFLNIFLTCFLSKTYSGNYAKSVNLML